MALLYFLEFAFFILSVLFVVTQIIIPLCEGDPLFSWFRRQGELDEELADARGDLEEVLLEEKIKKVKEETLRLKNTERAEESNEKGENNVR